MRIVAMISSSSALLAPLASHLRVAISQLWAVSSRQMALVPLYSASQLKEVATCHPRPPAGKKGKRGRLLGHVIYTRGHGAKSEMSIVVTVT